MLFRAGVVPSAGMPTTRDATLADLDALLALEGRCYPPATRYSRADYVDVLTARGSVNLVVDGTGGAVAFACAILDLRAREEAHVYTINVDPGARGRGVGRTVLGAIERRLGTLGVRRVRLEVNVSNAAAIRLYEAAGYVRRGRLSGYYVGEAEPDAFLYLKELTVLS